jgi:RNase P/RNase MRP subunit p29
MSNPNTMDLDKLSLQQALRDFETANARVLDLTQRLLRSEQERKVLADELERLRLKLSQAERVRLPGPDLLVSLAGRVKKRLTGALR